MPGNAGDSEWAEYYRFLSAEFGVPIDTSGPVFGRDHIMERIGGLTGPHHVRRQDPAHRQPGRRPPPGHRPDAGVPVVAAVARANRHPSLPLLIAHAQARYRPFDPRTQWLPAPDRPLFPPS